MPSLITRGLGPGGSIAGLITGGLDAPATFIPGLVTRGLGISGSIAAIITGGIGPHGAPCALIGRGLGPGGSIAGLVTGGLLPPGTALQPNKTRTVGLRFPIIRNLRRFL